VDIDPSSTRVLGQLGGICLISGGFLMVGTMPFVQPTNPMPLIVIAVTITVAGLVGLFLPWERWPRPVLMTETLFSLTCMTAAARLSPGALTHYLTVYVVALLFIGMTQRLRVMLIMAVVVLVSFLAGIVGVDEPASALDFAIAYVAGLLSALVLGHLVDRFREANGQIDDLLTATRELGRTETAADTVELLEAATCQLVGADSCFTFLSADGRARRYVSSTAGHPPFEIDAADITAETHERYVAGEQTLITDVRRHAIAEQPFIQGSPIRSSLLVPLIGQDERLGAVIVCWNHPVHVIDNLAGRALEIIAKEAAVVLERQRDAEQVRHEADTDALTGLLNRRAFDRALAAMAPGDCLIVLDLDDFKGINDLHGHLVGDQTLRSLAACMLDTVRASDRCARFGGDEFMVIVRGAGDAGAARVAATLQSRWAATVPLTTLSMGVAVRGADELGADTLARADRALYRAKANGRARFELADVH
jgi:diguanylate cyclase (GGDEF)-like protein